MSSDIEISKEFNYTKSIAASQSTFYHSPHIETADRKPDISTWLSIATVELVVLMAVYVWSATQRKINDLHGPKHLEYIEIGFICQQTLILKSVPWATGYLIRTTFLPAISVPTTYFRGFWSQQFQHHGWEGSKERFMAMWSCKNHQKAARRAELRIGSIWTLLCSFVLAW